MNIIISSEMFDAMIDHLIGARNCMTDRVDERIDFRAVDHIDAVLSTVPHGARADVDALLGRERDSKTMTMPKIIAGRAAAGLRDAGEMQREMGAARTMALDMAAETLQKFEAHIAELTDDDIALMEAMTRETASVTNEIYLRRME